MYRSGFELVELFWRRWAKAFTARAGGTGRGEVLSKGGVRGRAGDGRKVVVEGWAGLFKSSGRLCLGLGLSLACRLGVLLGEEDVRETLSAVRFACRGGIDAMSKLELASASRLSSHTAADGPGWLVVASDGRVVDSPFFLFDGPAS